MMAEYPEHDKLKALNGDNYTVGSFIEWLRDEKAFEFAVWDGDELVVVHRSTESLLSEYFEIDPKKLSEEKDRMLETLRSQA